MNKQKGIIIGVLALMVTMMVGYAIFSETITINGTATAKGDFNIKMLNASISKETGSSGATTNISADGKILTINIPRLEYPGAYVDVTYSVKNAGTIDALYTGYNIKGETERIKTYFVINNLYYASNDIKASTIRIYWDENNNSTEEENATVVLEVGYKQVANKVEACNELKKMEQIVNDCASYILDPEDPISCPTMYDFNHDGFIDGSDISEIDDVLYNKVQCPTN